MDSREIEKIVQIIKTHDSGFGDAYDLAKQIIQSLSLPPSKEVSDESDINKKIKSILSKHLEYDKVHALIIKEITHDINYSIIIPLLSRLSNVTDKSDAVEFEWVCNECNFPNFKSSISQYDIENEKLSCINCGGFEFHKQSKTK
jgi:hypothetical protein